MREIILDTETTGLSVKEGHRIVEIGCIEIENYLPTKKTFHYYLNPERASDKRAEEIHGLTREFLKNKLSLTQIRNRKLFTKSIVLNKDKKLGSKIYYEDLDSRKPLIGIPVYDYKKIINKKLKKDKKKGEFIKFKDLK